MADDVKITIGASFDQLANGINQAKGAIEGFQTGIKALAGAFAIREIAEFVSRMAELGEQTERTAAILGVSTTAAQELSIMSKLSGGSAEQLTTSLTRMEVGLQRGQKATSIQAEAFKAMGLNIKAMMATSPDKQVLMIADAVQKLNEKGINAAPALAMISRGFAAMEPMLRGGSAAILEWESRMREVGGVVNEEGIKSLSELHKELTLLGAAFTGLGATIVSAMTPSLIEMTKEIGKALGQLTGLIKTGDLANYILQYMAGYWEYLKAKISGTTEEVEKANKALQDLNKTFEAIANNANAALGGPGLKPVVVNTDAANQMKTAMKVADDAFKESEEIIKTLYDTFQITELQKTQLLLIELEKRRKAEIKAGEDVAAANAKYRVDEAKAVADLTKTLEKDWKSAADTIASAFTSQLRGMLSGQVSFAQAMKNVFASLIESLIAAIIKLGIEWAVQQLFMATVGRGMVAASAASFVSKLTSDAALVFGGVFANLAPVMGPAAAGPATASQASVLAQLAAVPKFAAGIDYVPRDMFAMIHQGERVVPAEQNTSNFAGHNISLNVSAIDARSFATMMRQNPRAFDPLMERILQRNAYTNLVR
jgi:hypothetical protein